MQEDRRKTDELKDKIEQNTADLQHLKEEMLDLKKQLKPAIEIWVTLSSVATALKWVGIVAKWIGIIGAAVITVVTIGTYKKSGG